jgi:hypothetical protein
VLLLGFALLTYWSTATGRTDDCGCYGDLLQLPPRWSIGANLVFALLVTMAWLDQGTWPSTTPHWKWGVVISVAGSAPLIAVASHLYLLRKRRPLLDLTAFRPGRRITATWMPQPVQDRVGGRVLLVFLSSSWDACKKWLPVLNVLHRLPGHPPVWGLLGESPEAVSRFARQHGLEFGVLPIPRSVYTRNVIGSPMGVLVRDNVVVGRWMRTLPRALPEVLPVVATPDTPERPTAPAAPAAPAQ